MLCAAVLAAAPALAADGSGFGYGTNADVKAVRTKKPVKVKLKRTDSGKYSWEITGDDVDEVLDADRRLRESINKQK